MVYVHRFLIVVCVALLQACGGGGGSGPTVTSSSAQSVAASSLSSASSSSQSSNPASSSSAVSSSSSSAASLPADFPTGTAETLPVLNLTTENNAPIISKETYLKGSFSLATTGAATVTGSLEIRGRGNSTWDWPKKPYRLKLTDSIELLGMPSGKNWVLLANYADKTLMRNDIAFMFSRSIGMEYTVRDRYVEVSLNGVYQGVYQLAEHIRVAKDRVNIPELKVTDITDDKISGGYLLEIDFRHNKDFCKNTVNQSIYEQCAGSVNTLRNVDFCIDSTHGMEPFCLDSPETLLDPAWSAQRTYIEKYFADTETALFGTSFADPNDGYAKYLDVDSVINYYIINELFKNPDGAQASAYLYKKRNGKLFFGPIWDFDLALGNAGYDGVEQTSGWHTRAAPWFSRLFQDPAFNSKVKARWQVLKAEGKLDLIIQYAEARAIWLNKQQQKNYQRWSITDVASWVNHRSLGTYDLEVKELIRWQRARIAWMDTQLGQ